MCPTLADIISPHCCLCTSPVASSGTYFSLFTSLPTDMSTVECGQVQPLPLPPWPPLVHLFWCNHPFSFTLQCGLLILFSLIHSSHSYCSYSSSSQPIHSPPLSHTPTSFTSSFPTSHSFSLIHTLLLHSLVNLVQSPPHSFTHSSLAPHSSSSHSFTSHHTLLIHSLLTSFIHILTRNSFFILFHSILLLH